MHARVVTSGRISLSVSSMLGLRALGGLDGTHQMSAYAYQVGNSSKAEKYLVRYTSTYMFIANVLWQL